MRALARRSLAVLLMFEVPDALGANEIYVATGGSFSLCPVGRTDVHSGALRARRRRCAQ